MSFDVLRDKAKMALVDRWLAEDEAEKERARRDDAVRRYLARMVPSASDDRASTSRRMP